jgi:hypothetical protein
VTTRHCVGNAVGTFDEKQGPDKARNGTKQKATKDRLPVTAFGLGAMFGFECVEKRHLLLEVGWNNKSLEPREPRGSGLKAAVGGNTKGGFYRILKLHEVEISEFLEGQRPVGANGFVRHGSSIGVVVSFANSVIQAETGLGGLEWRLRPGLRMGGTNTTGNIFFFVPKRSKAKFGLLVFLREIEFGNLRIL